MARITEILMEQNPIYNRQALGQTLPTMREKLAVRPSKSKYTIAAEGIQTPDATLGYVKGGNLLTAITNGLKSGLGFYGARQDRKAEQEYNQALADLAEKERADKLAQQAFENDYKDRQLTQQAELENNKLAQQAELAANQLANQKDIAQMNNTALNKRAEIARQNALEDAQAKINRENELYKRGLLEQGIDPDLYGKDAQYTALINESKKQQALQDQINTANIELGKSGKVGMDKVQQVIADPSRKLNFDQNSWLAKALGADQYSITEPQEDYQAPLSFNQITQNYKKQAVQQSEVDENRRALRDILGGK